MNNCGFDHKDFRSFGKEAWNSFKVEGKQAYILKEKLKMLRHKLWVWNVEVFGWMDLKVDKLAKELNDIDEILLNYDLVQKKKKMLPVRFGEIYTLRKV